MTMVKLPLRTNIYIYLIFILFFLFQISIRTLKDPPALRLLFKVDPLFVKNLQRKMKEDTSELGIPPFVVACANIYKKVKFAERFKDVYKYKVHGGLHSL